MMYAPIQEHGKIASLLFFARYDHHGTETRTRFTGKKTAGCFVESEALTESQHFCEAQNYCPHDNCSIAPHSRDTRSKQLAESDADDDDDDDDGKGDDADKVKKASGTRIEKKSTSNC